MDASATRAQIDEYRTNGFVVLRGFLGPDEIDLLDRAVTRAIARLGSGRVATNPELSEPPGDRDRVVVQRVNLWAIDDDVRRCVLDPRLGEMLASFAGVDALRLLHDQTFFKPPWADAIALHHDLPNWSFTDRRALQIWIALDEVGASNGWLAYLPGSHHLTDATRTARIRDRLSTLLDAHPALAEIEPTLVALDRGDAVVHSCMVVHASGANLSGRWRRAMTAQYFPDGAVFNGIPSVLTTEQLSRLAPGDPLDESTGHPLVWARRAGAQAEEPFTGQVC